MIIRSRRKNSSLIQRVFGRSGKGKFSPQVLNEGQFRHELAKEIFRSDRRVTRRRFGLIRLMFKDLEDSSEPNELDPALLNELRKRLRISDSIGWYESNLGFLLPETEKEGTLACANGLTEIALELGYKVDTEVSIYPDDDELISLAEEVRSQDSDSDWESPGKHSHADWSKASNLKKVEANGECSKGQDLSAACRVKMTKHDFVKTCETPVWKRTIDIIGAGTGLLLLSPLFLVAAIGIKATSKGPIFFRQMREGKNGKHFGILKFRTMVTDAEAKQAELRSLSEQDGPAFKLKNDPRITKIGKYLRKSCIDELPQLVNVLTGDMSLVGPRPLPIHESLECVAWQRARLTVLPGLTCTWQAYADRDTKFADWMRMDLEYIETRSLGNDLKLIFDTAFVAILHKGSA